MSSLWRRIRTSFSSKSFRTRRSHCPKWKTPSKSSGTESRVNRDQQMDPFDRLLENTVGSHGFWQWSVLMISVIGLPTYEIFTVFGVTEPAYRCRMPEPVEKLLQNVTMTEAVDILWGMNLTERARIEKHYPDTCYHRLPRVWQMFEENQTDWTAMTLEQLSQLASGQPVPCAGGYVYQTLPNQYPSSVIASFDLTCDRAWIAPLNTTMFMLGMLLGYYVSGWAGDRFGRRPTVIGWFVVFLITGYLASFSPNAICLCLAQFVLGAADSARVNVLFVQLFEMTTARWRSIMCSCWTVLQSFGTRAMTALLAFLLPDWRWLLAGMTGVGTVGILYICICPESPRWLVSQGRTDEAIHVLKSGYRYNHCCRKAPEDAFTESDILAMKHMSSACQTQSSPNERSTESYNPGRCSSRLCQTAKNSTLWEIFTSREHFKRLALGSLIFMCHVYSYYGIMLYGNKVRGLVYIVAVVNAATALPGTVISCILYRVFRWRKFPLLGMFFISLLSTLIAAVCTLTQDHETDLFLMITEGIALTTLESALDMIFIYIPELFPTRFRSKGLGFCGGFARIGAALCSFTNELDSRLGHGSPMAFYAVSIFVAILAVFALPDTRGENLEEETDRTGNTEVLMTDF